MNGSPCGRWTSVSAPIMSQAIRNVAIGVKRPTIRKAPPPTSATTAISCRKAGGALGAWSIPKSGHSNRLRSKELLIGTSLELPEGVTRSQSRRSGTREGRKDGDEIQNNDNSHRSRSPLLASFRGGFDGCWRGGKREDEPDRARGSGDEQSHRGASSRDVQVGEDGFLALCLREPVLLHESLPHADDHAGPAEDPDHACPRTSLISSVNRTETSPAPAGLFHVSWDLGHWTLRLPLAPMSHRRRE